MSCAVVQCLAKDLQVIAINDTVHILCLSAVDQPIPHPAHRSRVSTAASRAFTVLVLGPPVLHCTNVCMFEFTGLCIIVDWPHGLVGWRFTPCPSYDATMISFEIVRAGGNSEPVRRIDGSAQLAPNSGPGPRTVFIFCGGGWHRPPHLCGPPPGPRCRPRFKPTPRQIRSALISWYSGPDGPLYARGLGPIRLNRQYAELTQLCHPLPRSQTTSKLHLGGIGCDPPPQIGDS